MVPIFFGRRPPAVSALLGPALAYNLGLLGILASLILAASAGRVGSQPQVAAAGLGVTALGLVWLAIATGSVTGVAHRLRPASRSLARFVVSANRWAVVAGVLWFGAFIGPLALTRSPNHSFDDAGLHAFGTGTITMMIAGMVQMVAPVFARARMEAPPRGITERAIWPLLWAAAATRVAAALAQGYWGGQAFTALAGASGALGWAGLAALAADLVDAGAQQRSAGSRQSG